ncbi:MAG: hypothetical protein KDD40_11375, partial [Bdellovibrionales bacterium]|nr:hypothetical protein [Bdellovibrionales bacterium]
MPENLNNSFSFLDHLPDSEMRFHIEGLRCQMCLAKIYKLRDQQPGILELHVNMGRQLLKARVNKSLYKMSQLAQEITQMGYELKPLQSYSE